MKSSYTWKDLETRFSELSPLMKQVRMDAQWGSVPNILRVIGTGDPNALERFDILAAIAGKKLKAAMAKSSDIGDELRNESDSYTFWLKALKNFSSNFKADYVGEQVGYGAVFTGRLWDIATASANLCLSMAASFPDDFNSDVVETPKSPRRRRIPKENKTRAELQREIDSICPFCGNTDVGHFEIHHIDEDPSNNEFANLLLVCPTCHSKITKGDITRDEVERKKSNLSSKLKSVKQSETPSAKVINFSGIAKNAIVGDHNKVIIKNSGKPQKQKFPEGCIGSDNLKANYVSYLVTRYHEFQEYQIGKDNMNYAIFPSKLKSVFKIGKSRTINNVPLERFEELVGYIQTRIDGTMLGRIRKKRNQKNYSTFEEYLSEQKQ